MAIYFVIAMFLSLSSPPFHVSADVEPPINCSNFDNNLLWEIQNMKHKVAQLELLVEVTDLELYNKSLHIESCEKKIDEMNDTIHQLQSVLSNLKESPDDDVSMNALEEEVQELEIVVWKNDKELEMLKIRSKDAENWVKLLVSQTETMANIVSELWFHVQKLEQAQEVIERRTAELRRHIRNHRCSFFKFINKVFSIQHQEMAYAYTSKAMNQLRWLFSALKMYHHQMQGFVKQEMERNEFTSVLADDELVFILASVLIVFPLILATMWLSSLWR